jgi:hypothetical protein
MRTLVATAIAGICALALFTATIASAQIVEKPEAETGLSSRLYEVATEPSLSHLTAARENEELSLAPRGAGSLMRIGDALVVEVRASRKVADRVEGVQAAGAKVLDVSRDTETITVAVAPQDLKRLAATPGVASVTEVIAPETGSAAGGASGGTSGTISTCAGSVTNEADTQLRAATARSQYDVDGSGVEVGILSDSYDVNTTDHTSAAQDVASGDLPGPGNPCARTTPVKVIAESATGGNDEGRAMAQIIHDIAPDATIAFATANGGPEVFADNIRALAADGAKVIVDDVTYFAEPFFQDGPIAAAIDDVTAQGVAYYTAAGNDNAVAGANNIGAWETPAFRDTSSSCPTPIGAGDCLDFDPGPGAPDTRFTITLSRFSSTFVLLNWAEPWDGVTTDMDLFAFNAGTDTMAASSTGSITNQRPFEAFQLSNPTNAAKDYDLSILKFSGSTDPRVKFVTTGGDVSGYEYPVSSGGDLVGQTIYGHAGAAAAVSTGAVPYNDASTVERFSSRGPVSTYFGPVSGTTPAVPITQNLAKPDLVATDGGHTTFFVGASPFQFFSTSAAASAAAGVAALQLSANPSLSATQVEMGQGATAVPVGAFGPQAAGSGLVDAVGAIGANPPPPPSVEIQSGPSGPTTVKDPTFTFAVGGKTKTITCAFDAASAAPCIDAYSAPSLGEGPHAFSVTATDYFGQPTTATRGFTVDTTAPAKPELDKKPKKKSGSRKAKFTFTGESAATFVCALDKAPSTACTSPAKYKLKKPKPKAKRHQFSVTATDATGNEGPAAIYRWKTQAPKPT